MGCTLARTATTVANTTKSIDAKAFIVYALVEAMLGAGKRGRNDCVAKREEMITTSLLQPCRVYMRGSERGTQLAALAKVDSASSGGVPPSRNSRLSALRSRLRRDAPSLYQASIPRA